MGLMIYSKTYLKLLIRIKNMKLLGAEFGNGFIFLSPGFQGQPWAKDMKSLSGF